VRDGQVSLYAGQLRERAARAEAELIEAGEQVPGDREPFAPMP